MKKTLLLGLLALVLILTAIVFFVFQSSRKTPQMDLPKKESLSSGKSPALSQPAKKSVSVPAPPAGTADQAQAIEEIRHELQVVMDLNKKINAIQSSKSAQMLRIQEQALIHQKILASIQAASAVKPSAQPTREALLAQEKLRIIREETLRNKKLLEENRKS